MEHFLCRELGFDWIGGSDTEPPNKTAKTVVVACSGGADSTALTLILHCLARRKGGRVIVVHLDHCLRHESREDAAFVARLCEALGLELHSERLDVAALAAAQGLGLEEAGRNARYDLLEKVRRESNAALICTAHQLNDLAEDVLLRLARGAGWPGLGGLPGFDPQRRLLRPLLLTPKVELLDFLRGCQMTWREDASNVLSAAARNRMRHTLLPLFLRENPNFLESVARLWRQARSDEQYWQERIETFGLGEFRKIPDGPQAGGGSFFVPRERLIALHAAERLRLYKRLLDDLGPGQVLSDALHQLDTAMLERRDAVVQFPGLKLAHASPRGVRFGPDPRLADDASAN
ncbi:MAG: tRNA lysidine(34) synthetase TilS [Desulfovibrio sp.]